VRGPTRLSPTLVAAVLGAAITVPLLLAAQTPAPLRRGATVRVVAPSTTPGRPDRAVRGHLVRLANDTVIIETAGNAPGPRLQAFDLRGGSQLQILEGTHAHTVRGVLVGAATGALVLGGMAYATWHPCRGSGWACILTDTRETDTRAGAVLGAVVGSLIGLAIGSKRHGGHWVPVDTGSIQVSLGPARLRVAFRL
jgi:hypothetical protein